MKKFLAANPLKRRQVLHFFGGTIGFTLLGCWRDESASSVPSTVAQQTPVTPGCVIKPQQTEGPYFVDERLNRADIRSDPADGVVKEGVPLQLVFRVSQLSGNACTPLANAIVDIWHCDALGVYSDVSDPSFSTVGQKFLRGYQVTDANGIARFVTIYPGWYPGRAVHIHFKIRTSLTSGSGTEFTSQLYFDDALTDRVHAQLPYATKRSGRQRNNSDGIFLDGGARLLLQLTQNAAGYTGRFDIALA
ncbi:MAG: intradiol ring-cleavage dioxygenase [Cyanosarcina radialis HA8281-LM2]|jgi:protocatechuate 3,4-dioxygenase beta subunit|nr:intradiol ring-cleavage dioxygenase [Cyanosarcina radialis HA8281-LM2]